MSNMVINTNVMALNSHRNLKGVGAKQSKASQRLSSGYKINSAADDAAGLAISEKMRAQIKGLDMASKNTQDGVSLIQTAEGGMQEVDNMLQRIRELVDQVSNDTNENNTKGTGDRQKIQDEIDSLVAEIDSMAERVEFNNKKIINGSYADVKGDLELAKAEMNTVYNGAAKSASVLKASSETLQASAGTLSGSIAIKNASLEKMIASDTSKAKIDEKRASIETKSASLKTKQGSADLKFEQYAKKESDVLKLHSASVRSLGLSAINAKGSDTLHFQVGANANQSLMLNINSVKSDTLGIGNGKGISEINVVRNTGVQTTGYLDVLDSALSHVTTERSKLGATQNRLEYTQKSLDISSENLSASESRIRDADMAKEMMNMTSANVLQQAATSMLAQANQAPQNVLQLLG